VTQLLAPRGVAAAIGAPRGETSRDLMRVVGVREVTAGIGILTQPRPTGWLWGRVAGDLMDLVPLVAAFTSRGARPGRLTLATLNVLGVTALDLYTALRLSQRADAAGGRTANDRGVHTRKTVTVNRPVEEVYEFWRNVENLPRFMTHLDSVRSTGGGRSHWRAKTPAGTTVEWDAETVSERSNELIA
jgi:Polyketide cyclase / dehydrase and lipid transport